MVAGWAGEQPWAGVRGAFFFNLPCSIWTKLIFLQIKYFFAQQITISQIQFSSNLDFVHIYSGFHEFEHLNYNFCRPSVCMKILILYTEPSTLTWNYRKILRKGIWNYAPFLHLKTVTVNPQSGIFKSCDNGFNIGDESIIVTGCLAPGEQNSISTY